jgi:hypothetical protein
MAPGQQALPRQIEVGDVGGRDHYELNGIGCEEFFQSARDSNVRVSIRGVVSFPLQDGGKAQAVNGADHGSMEGASGETKANQANVDGL